MLDPTPAPGVMPRPPASEPPELGALVMGKERHIFHAGERIRVRVTSVRDSWLLAYQIPVVDGKLGTPIRLLPDARGDAPRLVAGRAFDLGAGPGAGRVPLAGPIGRGLIVLVGSPRSVVADEADQVDERALSGLEGAEVFPRLGPPALPDGWTCRVVRYDVL